MKCPNCQAKVHSGLNSLGERIVYEARGLMLVPELRVDGETILMIRPVFEEHECKTVGWMRTALTIHEDAA